MIIFWIIVGVLIIIYALYATSNNSGNWNKEAIEKKEKVEGQTPIKVKGEGTAPVTVRKVKYDDPSSNFMIVDVKGLYYRSSKAKEEASSLVPGDILKLRRERNNKEDSYAVKILTQSNFFIGYVPQEDSVFISSHFDSIIECRVFMAPDRVHSLIYDSYDEYSAIIFFKEDIELPE